MDTTNSMNSLHSSVQNVRPILDGTLVLASEELLHLGHHVLGGACDHSVERAELRAHGEVIERAALLAQFPLQVISRQEAHASGALVNSLDEPVLAEARRWVIGRGLCSGHSVALPAELVLVGDRGPGESHWQQSSVGTAAHLTSERAIENGLLEWVERVSIRMLWSGQAVIHNATDRLIAATPEALLASMRRRQLFVRAWLFVDCEPFQVALVLLGSAAGNATFGAAARLNADPALDHAFLEAVSVRAALSSSRLLDADRRVQFAIRAAHQQPTFLQFLEDQASSMTAPLDVALEGENLASLVEQFLGVEPWVVSIALDSDLAIERVFVPSNRFLLPFRSNDYILSPGYLE